ncbi:PA-phosphatase [Spirosoma rhododendri]|uniref:PA-phosphatase n=2 Tax=Spirosoma rhododendri TaxID=2728024 RepID=A0A7L5E0L3_9BACT|nr:PA-phosphatase [Spirosoma rhododendri]
MVRNLCLTLLLAGAGLTGCKENTISEGVLPYFEPATNDADGGTWRTVLLSSAATITVSAPTAITSDAYQTELTSVKNGLLTSTPAQNTAVNYWGQGGVVRWNQIARQLVAKYNTAPIFNDATGQYLATDPNAPVASLPFATRLYALLGAAQYDALVVAWRAKYQYNRPSLNRQGLVTRVPVADVPSYPSEGAAIAETSAQILTYFFPNEAEYIRAKATEHKQSQLWGGINVASDVKAGETLAASVAAVALTRARTDRFSTATDSWTSLKARAPYDVTWQSLEIPARVPVVPLAGRVKTWFDSTTVARLAPAAPPATSSTAFQTALAEVRNTADSRTRDQWATADYWNDGQATYTIAGHWNLIAEQLLQEDRQNELRAARTYALLNRALHDVTTVGWQAKYTYFVPRPSQLDPQIKTSVLIPNSPAYVSDHASQSAAANTILTYLFPVETTWLKKQSDAAIISTLYAGTQYRFSIDAGTQLGTNVGTLATNWAKADGAK